MGRGKSRLKGVVLNIPVTKKTRWKRGAVKGQSVNIVGVKDGEPEKITEKSSKNSTVAGSREV